MSCPDCRILAEALAWEPIYSRRPDGTACLCSPKPTDATLHSDSCEAFSIAWIIATRVLGEQPDAQP